MIKSGIYKITNKINGHSYIGMSKNIEKRWSDHKTKAYTSNREDDKRKVLYIAIRKYGVENFDFEILEECPVNDIEYMKSREVYWIKYYNTYEDKNHYNETPGGDIPGKNTVHLGEEHGMARLTEEDVISCRKCYKEGKRSRNIYNKYFSDKITYAGFGKMWHGRTWKHIMPEVFETIPHKSKMTEKDRNEIVKKFKESGMTISKYVKTSECPVGYGTLYKMVHNPDFYKGK